MYLAKTAGSGYRVYDSAIDAASRQRQKLIEELHLALGEAGPPAGGLSGGGRIVVHF